jgi:DNA-binding MarR family transcriptional regulator
MTRLRVAPPTGIGDHEAIRPSEIADQVVHSSSVTRQVRELEDEGFVDVTADPADRRSCLVTLTAAGSEGRRRLTSSDSSSSPCS